MRRVPGRCGTTAAYFCAREFLPAQTFLNIEKSGDGIEDGRRQLEARVLGGHRLHRAVVFALMQLDHRGGCEQCQRCNRRDYKLGLGDLF